jgi:DNA-binding transcriptional LysR family regulator
MADALAAGLGVALLPESVAAAIGPHLAFRVLEGLDIRLHTAIATTAGVLRPRVERFLAGGTSSAWDM